MKPISILTFNVDDLAESMKLQTDEVHSYFTDGRRVSFIMERRISREVIRGALASTEGAPYDVLAENGDKWEVRSLTRQGVYFCPSYMVGSGRAFQEQGFLEKLDEIEGYLIAHVDEFPEIPVYLVRADRVLDWYRRGLLGSTTKVTVSRAIELLHSESD